MMQAAFYTGRKRLFNRITAWWLRGAFSHCELVLGTDPQGRAICASSSFMDGGVRVKHMHLDPGHWVVVDLPDSADDAWAWVREHHGQGYDLLGLVGFVARVLGHDKHRWLCSEAVAAMLGIPDAWRFDPCTLWAALTRRPSVPGTPPDSTHHLEEHDVIGELSLRENDLDFRYLPAVVQASTPDYAEVRAVIDVSRFYSRGADHVIFAFDCEGGQGSNNPHCGPIIRDGENMFATARGVVVAANGAVVVEVWNGTFSPELEPIVNELPDPFDPCDPFAPNVYDCLAVRVRCHYAGGIDVRIRAGLGGAVLFKGSVPSAPWPWAGQMLACIGGIALGFVAPQDTGCVEQLDPRTAPDAKLGYAASSRVV